MASLLVRIPQESCSISQSQPATLPSPPFGSEVHDQAIRGFSPRLASPYKAATNGTAAAANRISVILTAVPVRVWDLSRWAPTVTGLTQRSRFNGRNRPEPPDRF